MSIILSWCWKKYLKVKKNRFSKKFVEVHQMWCESTCGHIFKLLGNRTLSNTSAMHVSWWPPSFGLGRNDFNIPVFSYSVIHEGSVPNNGYWIHIVIIVWYFVILYSSVIVNIIKFQVITYHLMWVYATEMNNAPVCCRHGKVWIWNSIIFNLASFRAAAFLCFFRLSGRPLSFPRG